MNVILKPDEAHPFELSFQIWCFGTLLLESLQDLGIEVNEITWSIVSSFVFKVPLFGLPKVLCFTLPPAGIGPLELDDQLTMEMI